MVNPFSRLTVRLFDSKAQQQSVLPTLQLSELAVVTPSPAAASALTWSSLFKKKSHNRTQSEKLEVTSAGNRRATLFRYSGPQQPKRRWTARKIESESAEKDEKKRVQLMSAEMQIQIAQLVFGYT